MNSQTHTLSGLRLHRSHFNLSHRKIFDCTYFRCIPLLYQFCLPGDVYNIGANLLVRAQPMLAPLMNNSKVDVRYFYVPLRLLEENLEYVVTGSKDGSFDATATVPHLESLYEFAKNHGALPSENRNNIAKFSLYDYLGLPVGNSLFDANCPLASYVPKAFYRAWWDYYRDENFNFVGDDFDVYYSSRIRLGGSADSLPHKNLRKNYFVSALPWQLKGIQPTFNLIPSQTQFPVVADFGLSGQGGLSNYFNLEKGKHGFYVTHGESSHPNITRSEPLAYDIDNHPADWSVTPQAYVDDSLRTATNISVNNINFRDGDPSALYADASSLSFGTFNATDLRTMFAQTRVFERLARCGSRYVEYLNANFGLAPRDDTLQRSQYLGGFSIPLVFTDVVQTAQDGDNAVGTLRGKGISAGGNTPVHKFVSKEFGILLGFLSVECDVLYSQGIDRTMTYKDRFDFFNPSFQNLSEQTIKNYELFVNDSKWDSSDFGFVPIYNELRKTKNYVCGNMRDDFSYWTQPVKFEEQPNLNESFIDGANYSKAYMSPFVVTDENVTPPFIIDAWNIVDAYRPISKYSIPGLIDHN